MGPPPRTRGTRLTLSPVLLPAGTTPAYAGNARSRPLSSSPSRDHPRVRGERARPTAPSRHARGPPPRTRGTHPQRPGDVLQVGTTPAYAGNAARACSPARGAGDHPRVRGERAVSLHDLANTRGPPPRTRGTRDDQVAGAGPRGTTPAYAGNAAAPASQRGRPWDHPRVRGERDAHMVIPAGDLGPPPRTRGTLLRRRMYRRDRGTTPAYAGNASRHRRRTRRARGPPPRTRGWSALVDLWRCRSTVGVLFGLVRRGTVPRRAGRCSPTESSAFGGLAPSLGQGRVGDGLLGGAADEGDAVEVDGCPLVVVNLKGESLFSWLLEDQECPAGSGHIDDSGPEP